MKNGALKEEEDRLKKTIINNLELQFVDEFQKWNDRVLIFNEVVAQYNTSFKRRLKGLNYDGFCRLFVKSSKAILDEHINMDNILPNPREMEEMKGIMSNVDDADEFKSKYAILLEAKYMLVKKGMALVWDRDVFRMMIFKRYGEQHYDGMLAAKEEVLKRLD